MNPTPCAVCGFSLLFLPPIIHVFLSFPVTAHIPAWLPIVPFPVFSACRLLHVSGHHLPGTLLCPHRHFSLSALHCHLLTPCTLSFLLWAPPSLCCPPLSCLALANTSPCSMSPLSPPPCPLSGLSGGGSRGAGCEKAPPGRAPAPGLAPLRPSEPTMAVPPGHGPFSGFPGPQEHTQVRVPLAPHLPGERGGWDRRVLGPKKMMWLPRTVCRA